VTFLKGKTTLELRKGVRRKEPQKKIHEIHFKNFGRKKKVGKKIFAESNSEEGTRS